MASNEENIKAAQKDLGSKLDKIFRATAISTFNQIIQGTPVDTGRARGNWQATLNSPYNGVLEGVPSPDNVNGKLASALLKDTLYLTNNLPYIESLENGHHSQQRPEGWVAQAVGEGQQKLDAATKKVL